MEWIADKSGRSDEAVLLKEEFVRLFPVPKMLEREMDLLVGKIVNHNT